MANAKGLLRPNLLFVVPWWHYGTHTSLATAYPILYTYIIADNVLNRWLFQCFINKTIVDLTRIAQFRFH